MIIPKSYKQFGRTVKVSVESTGPRAEYCGLASPDRGSILLTPGMSRDKLEHTFLHESIHLAMFALGRGDLFEDEAFTDQFAGLLHQLLTTGRGEVK